MARLAVGKGRISPPLVDRSEVSTRRNRTLHDALSNIFEEETTQFSDTILHKSTTTTLNLNARNTRFTSRRVTSATQQQSSRLATGADRETEELPKRTTSRFSGNKSSLHPATNYHNNTTNASEYSSDEEPATASWNVPTLPNMTELMASNRKNNTNSINVRKTRRERTPQEQPTASLSLQLDRQQPAMLPLPEDEKQLYSSIQLLKERTERLEAEKSEFAKREEEYEHEIAMLRAQLAHSQERPDSGFGSGDEATTIKDLKKQLKQKDAEISYLSKKVDHAVHKQMIAERTAKRVTAERDELEVQLQATKNATQEASQGDKYMREQLTYKLRDAEEYARRAIAERDNLRKQLETASMDDDERCQLLAKREYYANAHEEAAAERDELAAQQEQLATERDLRALQQEQIAAERDAALSDRDEALSERDDEKALRERADYEVVQCQKYTSSTLQDIKAMEADQAKLLAKREGLFAEIKNITEQLRAARKENKTYANRSSDNKTYDRATSDRKTYDRKSSDRQTCDNKSSDRKTYDNKSSGRQTYDGTTSDRDTSVNKDDNNPSAHKTHGRNAYDNRTSAKEAHHRQTYGNSSAANNTYDSATFDLAIDENKTSENKTHDSATHENKTCNDPASDPNVTLLSAIDPDEVALLRANLESERNRDKRSRNHASTDRVGEEEREEEGMTSAFIIPDITLDTKNIVPSVARCLPQDEVTDIDITNATIRPSQPPPMALASVIQQLEGEIGQLKNRLQAQQRVYAHLDPARSKGRRADACNAMEALTREINQRADQVYALYDVKEAEGMKV